MTLLRCVNEQEAKEVMEEVHEGTFGTHANGHSLAGKIMRAGMESDCFQHVKKCVKYQTYTNHVHVAPTALQNLTTPWLFSM
ncbi:hypothetical protein CR513_36854, partial [Mucuna pruriens]